MDKITHEEMKEIVLEILEVESWNELSESGSYDSQGNWCSQKSEAFNMLAAIEMVVQNYEVGTWGV